MTPAPLTILHVASPAPVGGLERVVHQLAVGHHARGHRVHVAALLGPGNARAFLTPLQNAGVPVHTLPISTFSVAAERRFVRSLCRSHAVEIVHTHGYRPDILDRGVAERLGLPAVTTEHGMSKMGGRTRLYEWLQMRAFRRFDAVVAVSEPIAATLERSGVDRARIHVVPNAWGDGVAFLDREAARDELGMPKDGFAIGFVGRLIGAKGCDVLLDAVGMLGDLPLSVLIVGEGVERPALEARCRELGIEDRVRFVGERTDARELLLAFDVFALPSRTEGTPIVLFEALAARVPVVACRVGGVPDVVTDAEALLVGSEDSAALARALRDVYDDREAASSRAEAGRARLEEHYSVEPWLDRYEQVYQSVRRPGSAT